MAANNDIAAGIHSCQLIPLLILLGQLINKELYIFILIKYKVLNELYQLTQFMAIAHDILLQLDFFKENKYGS